MTQWGSCLIRDPVRAAVYECIRTHPDIPTRDIITSLPEHSEGDVRSAILRLNGILIHPSGRGTIGRTWRAYR